METEDGKAVDWISVAQNSDRWWAVVYMLIHKNVGMILDRLGTVSFSRRLLLRRVSEDDQACFFLTSLILLKTVIEMRFTVIDLHCIAGI